MIVFGCSITSPTSTRCAEPGIQLRRRAGLRASSPTRRPARSFRSYNLVLDEAARRDDLEALVLVHQDAEIVDPSFCAKVREALGDPTSASSAASARSACASIAWWDGSVTWASFVHRYSELGGGDAGLGIGAVPATRARRGRHARRRPARALAVGGPQPALRRVARAAARLRLRPLPAGPGSRTQGRRRADFGSSTTTALELVDDARGRGRGAHGRVAEKWEDDPDTASARHWEARARARRGRGGRRAALRGPPACYRPPRRPASRTRGSHA